MPSNKDFSMSILVGGVELPEYHKDGIFYVESNLFTSVSYTTETSEVVQGEVEKQKWPVTPYQIKVAAKPLTPYSYYKVYVDGQKASQVAVQSGKSSVSEGFYDGVQITEFLFSLPRFPQNKKDRLEQSKTSSIGFIEVECWNSKVTGYKKPMISAITYNQANKKDSPAVTDGKYIMSTTKMGRAVRETKKTTVEDWILYNIRSKLGVKYIMGHSLVEMGFVVRPIRIPVHRVPVSTLNHTQQQQQQQQSSNRRKMLQNPRSRMMPQSRVSLPIANLPPLNNFKQTPKPPRPRASATAIPIRLDDEDEDVIFIDTKKRKIEAVVDLDLDALLADVNGTHMTTSDRNSEEKTLEDEGEKESVNHKDDRAIEEDGDSQENIKEDGERSSESNAKPIGLVDAFKIEIDVDEGSNEYIEAQRKNIEEIESGKTRNGNSKDADENDKESTKDHDDSNNKEGDDIEGGGKDVDNDNESETVGETSQEDRNMDENDDLDLSKNGVEENGNGSEMAEVAKRQADDDDHDDDDDDDDDRATEGVDADSGDGKKNGEDVEKEGEIDGEDADNDDDVLKGDTETESNMEVDSEPRSNKTTDERVNKCGDGESEANNILDTLCDASLTIASPPGHKGSDGEGNSPVEEQNELDLLSDVTKFIPLV